MATIIQIKRSSGTTSPSTLKLGEAAYTYGAGTQGNGGDRLYLGTGGVDGNGDANSIDIVGGKYFTALLDHVAGTATANSALIADGNLALDQIIVGNASAAGGQVKFNEGTNNGTNFVALKAAASLAASTVLLTSSWILCSATSSFAASTFSWRTSSLAPDSSRTGTSSVFCS